MTTTKNNMYVCKLKFCAPKCTTSITASVSTHTQNKNQKLIFLYT